MALYKNGEKVRQIPEAYNGREMEGMTVLCPRDCWKTREKKVYFPNGIYKGIEWKECPFHSRNPGCDIEEIFLRQYRRFWILRKSGQL